MVLTVLLCVVTVRISVAGVFQALNPAVALAWQPTHAGASATIAQRLAAVGQVEGARRLAVAAIARDPTIAAAYAAMGEVAEADGSDRRAHQFMTLALDMSRRDPRAQIWFIQRNIRVGDYAAVVRHFDVAMRTSARRSANLVPLLVTASVDSRLIPPLSTALSRDPTWKVAFLDMLVAAGRDLENVARLSLPHLDPARAEEREILARLVNRLAVELRFDMAWLAYRHARPGTSDSQAASLRSGDFTSIGDLPPFDWQLTDDSELTAVREIRVDRQGDYALALMAGAGRTGTVARQLLRLPLGRYALRFEMGRVAATVGDRPQVRISCASGNEILDFRPNVGWGGANSLAVPFVVPAGCRWQWLSVNVSSGSEPAQFPWIDNVAIVAR